MTLTTAARAAMFAQATGEAPIVLLTLSHPALSPALRFTSDAVATVSRGETYHPYPFRIVPPRQGGEEPQRATLAIDNVDRAITAAVRALSGDPLRVKAELVLGSSVGTVEAVLFDLDLTSVRIDLMTVTGELADDDPRRDPCPVGRMGPSTCPGLY